MNWLAIVFASEVTRGELLSDPLMMGRGILAVLETGTWVVGPVEVVMSGMAARMNGLLLALIWFGESLAIVVLAAVFAIFDGRGNTLLPPLQALLQ